MSGQRIIGLTGGIATGKTTVANFLQAQYNLPVIDADQLAREALTPHRLTQIRDYFGEQVFTAAGTLDRPRLGAIIFRDQQARRWLENLIHPFVREQLILRAKEHAPHTVMLVVPLLFEAELTDLVTEIWVVTCSLATQLQRLQQRNKLSPSEALLRINAQMPLVEKSKRATAVLDSEQPLEQLYQTASRLLLEGCT
ncbi:MAG: dephospho-CoA kinase [Pseudanabaenaceae cyanobacterium]